MNKIAAEVESITSNVNEEVLVFRTCKMKF